MYILIDGLGTLDQSTSNLSSKTTKFFTIPEWLDQRTNYMLDAHRIYNLNSSTNLNLFYGVNMKEINVNIGTDTIKLYESYSDSSVMVFGSSHETHCFDETGIFTGPVDPY